MKFRLLAIAAALPLAACAQDAPPVESTPAPAPASPPATSDKEMTCKADAAQSYVGQTASPALGGAILKAAGARTLRWVPPRSAVTQDYRIDRVNVMYDDAYKIAQINCG
ncbi:MAG: hypothetical protein KYX64_02270 [Sphingopyxis sp.]|nr:hypothetical protein [Sphingopyxis sp.]